MTKLLYIANARIPSEKAHGVAIMHACAAFVRTGVALELVVANRRNPLPEDAHAFYDIADRFRIRRLPNIDLFPWERYLGKLAYVIQTMTFRRSLLAYLRTESRASIVYTRDVAAARIAARLGFPTFLECHFIPRRRAAYLRAAREARGVVTVARTIQEQFLKAGFEEAAVFTEPNAVDLDVFDLPFTKQAAREEFGLSRDAFLIGYTGNFTTRGEEKGLADALAALAALPGSFQFIAVGGSPSDRVRYESLARTLGVADRVTLVGYVSQHQLARYQKAMDVLVMPFPDTPYYRAQMSPLKAFEYAASKRPIVATDLPTIREILDEHSAFVISPGDIEALAGAIEKVAHDPAAAETKAHVAYATVAQTHTWDARARRILTFIASLARKE